MTCHDAECQIFAERDGALDPDQRAALADHLVHCSKCRRTRDSLTAAVNSWRAATQNVRIPDPLREWQTLRRQIRGAGAPRVAAKGRRNLIPWLAVPLGAAAALAIAFFVGPNSSPLSTARASVRGDSVEISAADGSVVFVDDRSGWVVVWEGDGGAKGI